MYETTCAGCILEATNRKRLAHSRRKNRWDTAWRWVGDQPDDTARRGSVDGVMLPFGGAGFSEGLVSASDSSRLFRSFLAGMLLPAILATAHDQQAAI